MQLACHFSLCKIVFKQIFHSWYSTFFLKSVYGWELNLSLQQSDVILHSLDMQNKKQHTVYHIWKKKNKSKKLSTSFPHFLFKKPNRKRYLIFFKHRQFKGGTVKHGGSSCVENRKCGKDNRSGLILASCF